MYESDKKYREIACCNISQMKQLVISENAEKSLVMAKRVMVHDIEENTQKMFFEKGATIIREQHIENFKKFLQEILDNI